MRAGICGTTRSWSASRPTELQQLYADATRAAPAQPDLTRIARAEPDSDPGKLVGPAVIGVVAVALVGTVWWVLTLSGDKCNPQRFTTGLKATQRDPTAGRGPARLRRSATAANTGAASGISGRAARANTRAIVAAEGAKSGVGAAANARNGGGIVARRCRERRLANRREHNTSARRYTARAAPPRTPPRPHRRAARRKASSP